MNTIDELQSFMLVQHGTIEGVFQHYYYNDFSFDNNEERLALEHLISTDVDLASDYAFVTGKPFKMAEELFTDDPHIAFYYAQNSIKGKWEPGENVISKNPHYACRYAMFVLKNVWPAGEEVIATDVYFAYTYSQCLMNYKRWPLFEQNVKDGKVQTNPEYFYKYAEDIVCGPWKEAEFSIAESREYAMKYAEYILKDRFKLGESAISRSSYWKKYCTLFGIVE